MKCTDNMSCKSEKNIKVYHEITVPYDCINKTT